MVFRCTKKAQEGLRLAPRQLEVVGETPDSRQWYSNLVMLGRRRFFLCTHALSLFSFWTPAAGVTSTVAFGRVFRDYGRLALEREGFGEKCPTLLDEGPDLFAGSGDRGVLGSMTDFALMSQVLLDDQHERTGQQGPPDLRMLHEALNLTPMSRLGMETPRDALREILDALPGT